MTVAKSSDPQQPNCGCICLHISVVSVAYCLSNAMHGQNINLPVSVCVSITLSVSSAIG